jgi:hypothetical protein
LTCLIVIPGPEKSTCHLIAPNKYRNNHSLWNRWGMVLSIALFLALLLASIQAGSAAVFNVGVGGTWTSVNGGGTAPTCYLTSNSWNSVSGTYASYGWPPVNNQCGPKNCPGSLNLNTQSGFGFVPATVGSITDGVVFKLGTFTHYNHPICTNDALSTIDLIITLTINGVAVPFTYTMNLDETTNSGVCGSNCAYSPCSTPCPDRVWWSNLGSSTNFTSGGIVYTLEVTGFSTNCGTPGTIIGEFVTQENTNNVACIYGKIVACGSIVIGDPSPMTVCSGGTASFSVSGPGITYQWYKVGSADVAQTDGTKSSGATFSGSKTATLTITGATSSEAGSYYVIVGAACNLNKKSASALLTVRSATAITTHPASQTVCAGGSVTFNVIATGSGTLTYQWQQSKDGGTTWSDMTGQTGSSLTLSGVTYSMNNYRYRVVVTSSVCGSVNSNSATLTANDGPIVNAGSDQTVCSNVATVSLTGTNAGQTAPYKWTTSGTGTFSTTTALTTTYTPSTADKALASITLTLTATKTSGSCTTSTDSMVLYFQKNPVASAGSDLTICEPATTVSLTGTNTGGPAAYLWTSPTGGTFSAPSALTTTYTPTAADKTTGSVIITLTATGTTPCSGTSADTMLITIQKNPVASAGTDQIVCENIPVSLTGTNTGGAATYLWTTSGTGTFSFATALITTYTPSAAEKTAGSVTITLTATGTTPCSGTSVDSMLITIQKNPVASAGLDKSVCENVGTVSLTGTNTGGPAAYLWTSPTGGTFSAPTALTTTYTPTTADKTAGSVIITLTATGTTPCSGTSADSMLITIQPKPTANAGPDQTICKGSTVTLAGLADHYGTVTWTGGAGTFTPNEHTLTATYTPTQSEIDVGFVTLTLTATALPPCPEATDQMTITMHGGATAIAPGPQRICSTVPSLVLTGTAENFASLSWTKISGPGTVTQSITNPKEATYSTAPDPSAIYTETVVKFTATGISPCTGSVDSFVTIRVDQVPVAYVEVVEP